MKDDRTRAVYRLLPVALFFWIICSAMPGIAGTRGKLYVVGMGPAGPDLTAPRVLAIVREADYLLCSPGMPKRFDRFAEYIDPGKVAFNPWEGILGNTKGKTDPQSIAARRERQRKRVQDFVREKIAAGKTVVMMDGGDPCVYGPSLRHLLAGMDDRDYEVIPGMGAFNAAAAALKRSMTCDGSRFVMLTSPQSLFGEDDNSGGDILKDLSKYKTTMVMYMSLRKIGQLARRFRAYYPPDLPIAVVYYAGYSDKESVLMTSLAHIESEVKKRDESWLGLVLIGECVR